MVGLHPKAGPVSFLGGAIVFFVFTRWMMQHHGDAQMSNGILLWLAYEVARQFVVPLHTRYIRKAPPDIDEDSSDG